MTSPDPVAQAAAYQRYLLAAVGDDDAADVQESTPALLRQLIADAGSDLRRSPANGEWSVIECVGHIVDAEIVVGGRYRWILAQDEPDIVPYDQDLWVTELGHREADPDTLLALFDALRAADLELWRRTTPAERARVGIHRERGPESLDLTFRMLAGHDRVHLAQGRTALETVRSAASSGSSAGDPVLSS